MESRHIIAKRVARELKHGDVVNLGIGLPTEVVKYIPEGVAVILQSENGIINMGPPPKPDRHNPRITTAGGGPASVHPGGAFLDSALSFAIIRGGHVSTTVQGAFQVDQEGSLANWKIPGKLTGMGGAMDLVTGARKVIVAMEHCAKDGSPRILKKCTLPLTAKAQVNLIITEKAVLERRTEGLVLTELASGTTLDDVLRSTEAELIIAETLQYDL